MQYARAQLRDSPLHGGENIPIATLMAYDLQAGSYIGNARANPEYMDEWTLQLADLVAPLLPSGGTVLEVGVGEATTLSGVLKRLAPGVALGCDLSWSRVHVANQWLYEQDLSAALFVGDLFRIPLADASVDVVYTSHSLEPNGGREHEAIAELFRVARHGVVMVEPIYELAPSEAQERMRAHGYVRGLREAAEMLDAELIDYRLLPVCSNPLNPSGVVTLRKSRSGQLDNEQQGAPAAEICWQCPITRVTLRRRSSAFVAAEAGLAYPLLEGIPLLRGEHAVVASLLSHT